MVNLLNKNSTMTTRNFLENCFNGTQPIKRENPRAGESAYFYLVEDKNQLFPEPKPVDVPNGVDPYAFRDAGYKIPGMQSTQDTGSFTNNTSPSASPGLTSSSSTPSLSVSSSSTPSLSVSSSSTPSLSVSSSSTSPLQDTTTSNGLTSSTTPSSNPLSTPGTNRTSTDTTFSNSSTSTAHPWEKSNFSLNQSASLNNGFTSSPGTGSALDNNPYSLYKNPWDFGMQNNTSVNPYDSYSQTTNPWSGLNAFSGAPQSFNGGLTSLGESQQTSSNPYDLYNQTANPWSGLNMCAGKPQSFNNSLNTPVTLPNSPDQDKTYMLQAHSRKLENSAKSSWGQGVADFFAPYHSGFDLIEADKYGNKKMQSLDLTTVGGLFPTGGTSEIQTREGPVEFYTLPDGREVIWHNQLKDSQKRYQNVPNYLMAKKVETLPLLEGKQARDAFYKMQVNTDFMNPLRLDYDLEGPNCNTCTTTWFNDYVIPGYYQTVSDLFNRNHWGDGGSYKTLNTTLQNQNARLGELATNTYLDNTSRDGYPRPRNIRYVPGTSTTGPMMVFSNGKNQFVINSHDRNTTFPEELVFTLMDCVPLMSSKLLKNIIEKKWPKKYDIYMDNKLIKSDS